MTQDGENTPQMVISGAWQCGGFDAGTIERAVAAARSQPALGRTSIQTSLAPAGSRKLQVKVSAQLLTAGPGRLAVRLPIYESGLLSKIGPRHTDALDITPASTVTKLLPSLIPH